MQLKRMMPQRRDLFVVLGATTVSYALAVAFHVFERLAAWTEPAQHWQSDEILAPILVGTITSAWLYRRRFRRLQAQRSSDVLARQAQHHVERRLRLLLDELPIILWATDRELRFTSSLGAGLAGIGLKSGELDGVTLYEHFNTSDPDFPAIAAHLKALAGQSAFYEHDSGESAYRVHVKPLRDRRAQIIGTIAAALDVTEHRRTQQALQSARDELEERVRERTAEFEESRRALSTLLSNLPGAAYRGGNQPDRVFEFISEGCLALTGHPASDLMEGRVNYGDLIHVDDRSAAWNTIQAAVKESRPYQLKYRITSANGDVRWVCEQGCGVYGSTGALLALEGFITNITQRVLAEERAQQHQAELAHVGRLGTMGELASGMAHELNQPLTAIINYAEACVLELRSSQGGSAEVIDNMEEVVAQAERAGQIIRRLRNFVRRRETKRSTVHLNHLIREVTELLEAEMRLAQITLRLDLSDDLPQLRADSIQIEQVLLNLVRNAIDAMSATEPEKRALTIRSRLRADGVEASVCDSGPGLSPEIADRLFHPFASTKLKGLGLGLSISQSIIQAHGGRIWAEANAEQGTMFIFTLPFTGEGESSGAETNGLCDG